MTNKPTFLSIRVSPELKAKLEDLAGPYPLATWIRVQLIKLIENANKES